MKKILLAIMSVVSISHVFAADGMQVSRLVRDYSETVACSLEDYGEPGQLKQYSVVKVADAPVSGDDYGATWLVYWAGDLGCSGGNGTILPRFSVVRINAGSQPIVTSDYSLPDMNLVKVTSMSSNDGIVTIRGVAYGETDRQHDPTKQVQYVLKFDDEKYKFVLQ